MKIENHTRLYIILALAVSMIIFALCFFKRIWEALANGRKSAHTIEFLGADIEEVAFHLENQFEEGMSWDNYNHEGWHVDHIRPLTSFDLIDYDQQFVCFNWRNLQPMWRLENMTKGDNYTEEDEKIWVKRMRDLGFKGKLYLKYSQKKY